MAADNMVASTQSETKRERPLREIAKEFLRLGFVAYGGPAAHIAMMEERFVRRLCLGSPGRVFHFRRAVHIAVMEERFVRRLAWVSRERFLDLVGAVNLLPGPSSTELAIYLGEIRGGLAGLILAGACFILPAAFLVVALSWVYGTFGAVTQVSGVLFGIKPGGV